jgi:hypothetical protein
MCGGYAEAAPARLCARTLPPVEACVRCGEAPGEGRFCGVCGADQRPDEPLLRTAEALEAARREEAWLAEHPEVGREIDEARRRAVDEEDAAAPPLR